MSSFEVYLLDVEIERQGRILFTRSHPSSVGTRNRGYVDEAVHWRYSSARDYEGIDGLIEVERFW